MLPCFVFALLQLSPPFRNPVPYPLCFELHAKPSSHISFVLITIQNHRGWGWPASSSLQLSACYLNSAPLSPVFATLTKTTGVYPNYSHNGNRGGRLSLVDFTILTISCGESFGVTSAGALPYACFLSTTVSLSHWCSRPIENAHTVFTVGSKFDCYSFRTFHKIHLPAFFSTGVL
jgi:hypothetical protein